MPEILDFEDAVAIAGKMHEAAPVVLLGNGFSMAYRRDIFSYQALFESVDWGDAPCVRTIFDRLGTTDFEYVMHALDSAADIIDVYQPGELAETIRFDADFLKDALIRAISRTHPETIFAVDPHRMHRAVSFLKRFGRVFTLNYDLLLYCMRQSNYRLTEAAVEANGPGPPTLLA